MSIALRDYQERGNEAIRNEFRRGNRRVLYVMPTGAGKTISGAHILAGTNRKGKKVLWLADTQELVDQAGETFTRAGVRFSEIMSGYKPDRFGTAWTGTIQSWLARHKRGDWLPGEIDLLVVDEAHRAESRSYRTLYEAYPDAFSIGLTATPMRGDGRGLGNTYQAMVTPVSTRELIEQQYLVPPRYFIPSTIDVSSVQRDSGDYTREEREHIAAENPQLIGDIVENFARICPERRFVAFPGTIAESLALRDQFNAAGIPTIHIDGYTSKKLRRELMAEFKAGNFQGLTSVNIAIEGLDVPDVGAVINARVTKSQRIWVQMVGRGLRSYPQKSDCIVLDHAGGLTQFAPAEDFVPPALHSRKGRSAAERRAACRPKTDPKDITCEACSAVFHASRICPSCGHVHEFERAPKPVLAAEGDLEELTPEGRMKAVRGAQDKRRWWGELQQLGRNKGYAPGWAIHKFREKFSEAPPSDVPPLPPSPEVLAWVKSRNIAYARRMEKERAQREGDVKHAAD